MGRNEYCALVDWITAAHPEVRQNGLKTLLYRIRRFEESATETAGAVIVDFKGNLVERQAAN